MGPTATARRLDRITQAVALIGFAGLVGVAFLIFYDGGARYLNAPRIHGLKDYGEVVYPLVIASCFPAGLLRQTNVTVRVFGKVGGGRLNAWLEAFAAFVVLVFFAILAWQFVKLTGKYADAGRTTRTIGIPLAPWWWVTTAIMATCVPVQFYVFLSWLRAAVSQRHADHEGLSQAELDTLSGSS
jgi:TRAP-type C4-dicarboxylate transport system permease small subunit